MANIGIEVSEIMAGVAMLMTPQQLDNYSKDMSGLVKFLKEGKKLGNKIENGKKTRITIKQYPPYLSAG